MTELLKIKKYNCRVSSVLEKNTNLYGKHYMFDDDESTCWNSDQGKQQWIKLEFDEPITLTSFQIQFQGGFAGKDCLIETFDLDDPCAVEHHEFYPEDSNKLQTFKCFNRNPAKNVLFLFRDSFDTYGRIIVYKLAIFKE